MKYLILAGGSGTRLWPLSRKNYPKQFLNLVDDYSMLQNTAKRVSKTGGDDIYIITNASGKRVIMNQMRDIFPKYSENNIIIEPIGRNTAPAIAFSSIYFKSDDVVTILSSDHHVTNSAEFNRVLSEAEKIARKNFIVTLGIIPTSPKTGYGYIKKSANKIDEGFVVENFVEKPTLSVAQDYLKDGSYYWNAGIFIFQVGFFLSELAGYSPKIYDTTKSFESKIKKGGSISVEEFKNYDNISIDYALMEKSDKIAVVPADIGWSDIGSFQSLYEILPRDKDGVATRMPKDKFINLDSKNILAYGGRRIISTIGLENLAIIDTDDSLLISDFDSVEKIKEVVKTLETMRAPEAFGDGTEITDWGYRKSIYAPDGYRISEIVINPGSEIKLHYSKTRGVTWTVVEGSAEIVKEDKTKVLSENESEFFPAFCKRAVKNTSKSAILKLVEIKTGKINDDEEEN
ncbi:MAG TPA: mannose-1-phosphate guanylyltransferase/mannose-6-phosphate isomerase [Spirochaetota bacterium]|nr:mannose-1-phosphate guanylyltransferase/mannose-6-phosphate isomerase [Spirochaetota bacterium]HOS31788.1 mannose-1-phosphate guanylyltransferase/mannose-6-phosphate isomerase [Spirochaetota bacterium]HOS55178.1 mannose-1-phosphate guanylyltransferase/mannose-6-phosphate isomerase [Spirochaetota bacterium]HPK62107.1 mannose-1-phosphate guanylyltransferase/mannose-6-phosphate isomerase [Spirochaetota bacterium]HQF77376.1 mannose-1-phosphate guanylyltransferase/mannose-6-phosphate isomerase [S